MITLPPRTGIIIEYEGTITLVDRISGGTRRAFSVGDTIALARDGRYFVAPSARRGIPPAPPWYRHDLMTGARLQPESLPATGFSPDLSSDGRSLVDGSSTLYDFALRRSFLLAHSPGHTVIDEAGRYLAFRSESATVVAAGVDTNGASDVFVADLPAVYDQDADTLDDRWEMTFGLSTASGVGADGPAGDPDGDGFTNAQELAAGTHPRGTERRFLAEGATGSFFRTRIALVNPDLLVDASSVLTFAKSDGTRLHVPVTVPAGRRATVDPASYPPLLAADFSTAIESDRPIVVDRTMFWGRPDTPGAGYGAHTETSLATPATTWHLAEGSTVLEFNLFYLLQNPQPTPVQATVRYLRPSGAPITKVYDLPANSRTTILVNQADTALDETDVSGEITSTAPIVVERAMYRNREGRAFDLGHASAGVTTPSANWFLAEGATGTFFDLYVLVANPNPSPASIAARFLKPDGTVVTRNYIVNASSRFSIFVDAIPGLEDTPVSTEITSTSAAPVIVERAMYWPGGFFDYYGGHSSAGTTTTALRWALAEGESGGASRAQTYLLVANTATTPGRVRVQLLLETGRHLFGEFDLPASSRTTIPILSFRERFGVVVESIGASPVPIVVEGAYYWSADGVVWSAGSNVVATRLP